MAYQSVFKRYELKYSVTPEQKNRIVSAMAPYMDRDEYGRSTVRNLYFDTDTYILIRRSLDRPEYKEKLRIRSYERVGKGDIVFAELKKKYRSVVYKRRISLPYGEAMDWLTGKGNAPQRMQIANEIDYFKSYYKGLHPTVFLSYEREAFYAADGSGFRVTFDDNILVRQDELTLDSDAYGVPILPEGSVLMEIKCSGGIPLWMSEILSRERIYKTSFSKYGTAYRDLIFPEIQSQTTHNENEEEYFSDGKYIQRTL